jgi:hypothetical protein
MRFMIKKKTEYDTVHFILVAFGCEMSKVDVTDHRGR